MNVSVEVLKLCRLCQSKPGVFKVLSDNLSGQIYECTNIKLEDELFDLLPSTVCEQCKQTVCSFFKYLQEIRKVDAALRRLVLPKPYDKSQVESEVQAELSTGINGKHEKKKQKKQFQCPVCLKRYARLTNLQLHKRIHSILFCFTCDLPFDDTDAKSQHVCKVKEPDTYSNDDNALSVSCDNDEADITDGHFVKSTDLSLKKEWLDDKFPVNAVNTEQNLKEADVRTNSKEGESATGNKKAEQNDQGKGTFKCKICDKEFVWRVDLWLHKKNHKAMFICKWENCNKICTSAYTLKTHEMNHEGKRPFLCVTCGKGFITKNSLNCHEKIHLDVKPYACEICNIGFSVRSNLRAHEKKYHEGIRFYCSKCTRAYISKSSLERHERLHTGIREFQCESCPSAFYTNKELVKHQRYHQGIRKYKCDQCFKSFFEKHHLTVHLRYHTGEKPYACKVSGCGKSFTESQKLSRHLKARHSPHI